MPVHVINIFFSTHIRITIQAQHNSSLTTKCEYLFYLSFLRLQWSLLVNLLIFKTNLFKTTNSSYFHMPEAVYQASFIHSASSFKLSLHDIHIFSTSVFTEITGVALAIFHKAKTSHFN